MVSTSDLGTSPAADICGGELLPLSPYDSLKYHFGMLLGVDDFETEQAYHRAKMRLHNAWLHRQGVVWGFGVSVNNDRGEIRVKPGLALDAAGHELHLEADYCINIGEWFAANKEKDPDFNLEPGSFSARVVICFKACLNHQVPALLEPCDTGGTGTAYSRVHETLDIRLLPNRAPDPVYPYHRLRLLFGLDAANPLGQARFDELIALEAAQSITRDEQALLNTARTDREVPKRIKEIQDLGADQQSAEWLKTFHRFAALDEIDLQPATSEDGARQLLCPGDEDDCLLLADVNELQLTKADSRWILSGGKVDLSVRPSHVATTTIQDLLCGQIGAMLESQTDAGGPRIDPASVNLQTSQDIMFTSDKALAGASVQPIAFSVTWFDPAQGWRSSNVNTASYGGDETKTVSLQLNSPISGRVRLMVSGTGAAPLLGADLVPLAGAVGGPPGGRHNGHDFVFMKDFVAGPAEPDDSEKPSEEGEEAIEGASEMAAMSESRPKKRSSRKQVR
jgi:hypothetical protein